jgi:hypothetical protein
MCPVKFFGTSNIELTDGVFGGILKSIVLYQYKSPYAFVKRKAYACDIFDL